MECYIFLEYNTFLSFFLKCYFSFSLRHHLSSHAHTGVIFSLTQALTPIFPFPLPNHMLISLSLPLPFLLIASHLPSLSFSSAVSWLTLSVHHTWLPAVRQTQHTHLSTGFVCLVWAMLPHQISNLPSCQKVWGHERQWKIIIPEISQNIPVKPGTPP